MTPRDDFPDAGSPRDVDSPRDVESPADYVTPYRSLSAAGWETWAKQRELVERVLPAIGEGMVLGSGFPCVVPGHGAACTARVRFDGDERGSGTWRYRCGTDWRSLAEVRASVIAKADIRGLSSAIQRLWFGRCALEAGLVESTVRVLCPALPSTVAERAKAARVAPSAVDRLYAGFVLALRVRGLRDPNDRAVMFAPEFAGPWSGISVTAAKKARLVLAQSGAIHAAGTYQLSEHPHLVKLWALGPAEGSR